MHKNIKKMDLVGIPYKVTYEEAIEAFVNENPSLGLSVKADDACTAEVSGNPDMYISVVGVKKCYETKQYRVLFRTTELLINTIDGWKIKLFSCIVKKYILPDSVQCHNCCGFGHFADKCKSPSVCAKCASTEHKTRECTSKTYKCINCSRKNFSKTDHPAYSHRCPCFK